MAEYVDFAWVKIRSWHIVARHPFGDAYLTMCGRITGGPEITTPPGNEKSCESCARIALRKYDR